MTTDTMNNDKRLRNGNKAYDLLQHPRCGAKKRRSEDTCQQPAMANGRCRLHGGLSTGPKTKKGLANSRKANLKHGGYSAEFIKERKDLKLRLNRVKAIMAQLYP